MAYYSNHVVRIFCGSVVDNKNLKSLFLSSLYFKMLLYSGINFLNFILRVMLTVNLIVQRRKLLIPVKACWLVFYYNIYYKYTNCVELHTDTVMDKFISLLTYA